VFRAQYERKKKMIQMERYEQGKEQALAKESSELTEEQISELLLPHVKQLLSERTGKLSVDKMRNWLRLEEGIMLSPWKTRQIKGAIEIQHYKVFEQLKEDAEAERVSKSSESVPPVNENTEGAQPGSELSGTSESKD
jgi:hypothetical protein